MRKQICGLEGLYEIDEQGNIYSLPKLRKTPTTTFLSKEKQLKPYPNTWGYLLVDLRKDGKRYLKCVHRLVAETFIPNPENKPQVNHKDGNKLNNTVNNLEWVTCSENQQHAFDIGIKPQGENHPKSKLTNEQVKLIRKMYKPNERGYGIKELSKKFNVSPSTIRQILVGLTYKNI